jgi:hypothetical protein
MSYPTDLHVYEVTFNMLIDKKVNILFLLEHLITSTKKSNHILHSKKWDTMDSKYTRLTDPLAQNPKKYQMTEKVIENKKMRRQIFIFRTSFY